jgi:hypothetical protein
MKIYNEIKKDLTSFVKNGDTKLRDLCKVILGEVQRDPKKDYTDKNIIRILKTLRKITLKNTNPDPLMISMIETYLPGIVSDIECIQYVKGNYTYSDIIKLDKKAFSIIGNTKKHFAPKEINSVVIKKFITEVLAEGGEVCYNDTGKSQQNNLEYSGDVLDIFKSVGIVSLLPCPFCGCECIDGPHKNQEGDSDDISWWIECTNCECIIDGVDTSENAIKVWNSRKLPIEENKYINGLKIKDTNDY